jgi:hypothetical protein
VLISRVYIIVNIDVLSIVVYLVYVMLEIIQNYAYALYSLFSLFSSLYSSFSSWCVCLYSLSENINYTYFNLFFAQLILLPSSLILFLDVGVLLWCWLFSDTWQFSAACFSLTLGISAKLVTIVDRVPMAVLPWGGQAVLWQLFYIL